MLDGKTSESIDFTKTPSRTTNLCGHFRSNDGFGIYDKNLTHTGTSLTVSIEPILDEPHYNESFGIREFFIVVVPSFILLRR